MVAADGRKIRKDLTGKVFGRLTAIRPITPEKWLCQCSCGETTVPLRGNLVSKKTQSCGCYKKESTIKSMTTHGGCSGGKFSDEYKTWAGMIRRCRYGGRTGRWHRDKGITVCRRWSSFKNFKDDMGKKPEGMTLERINNKLGYSSKNCKWATWKEQGANKENSRFFVFCGKRMIVPQWSEETGIPKACLWYRINAGWPLRRVFTEPVGAWLKNRRRSSEEELA